MKSTTTDTSIKSISDIDYIGRIVWEERDKILYGKIIDRPSCVQQYQHLTLRIKFVNLYGWFLDVFDPTKGESWKTIHLYEGPNNGRFFDSKDDFERMKTQAEFLYLYG